MATINKKYVWLWGNVEYDFDMYRAYLRWLAKQEIELNDKGLMRSSDERFTCKTIDQESKILNMEVSGSKERQSLEVGSRNESNHFESEIHVVKFRIFFLLYREKNYFRLWKFCEMRIFCNRGKGVRTLLCRYVFGHHQRPEYSLVTNRGKYF